MLVTNLAAGHSIITKTKIPWFCERHYFRQWKQSTTAIVVMHTTSGEGCLTENISHYTSEWRVQPFEIQKLSFSLGLIEMNNNNNNK